MAIVDLAEETTVLHATKHVFMGSDKARLRPVSSAIEISQKIEISLKANLDMILSNKSISKALISLRGYAGWSAPLLFANSRRHRPMCNYMG